MSKITIRKVYLYVAALIGLILIIIGGVRLVDLGLKTWIFTEADISYRYPAAEVRIPQDKATSTDQKAEPTEEEWDEYEMKQLSSRRQRTAANSLAFLIIGIPLYAYHWRLIRKES